MCAVHVRYMWRLLGHVQYMWRVLGGVKGAVEVWRGWGEDAGVVKCVAEQMRRGEMEVRRERALTTHCDGCNTMVLQ